MKRTIVIVVIGLVTLTGCNLPACVQEDDTWCHWNADVQGNGQGQSFVVFDEGQVVYLD